MEKFSINVKDPRKSTARNISSDGVDVNTGNRHHSVWPVLTVIYNLPPWLCMKRKFIMLSGSKVEFSMWERYNTVLDFLPIQAKVMLVTDDIYHIHPFRKQKKAFNGQQEFLPAPILMTGEQIYNEVETLPMLGKTKDGVNARWIGVVAGLNQELFAMQEEVKTNTPSAEVYTLTKNKPEGCIAKETIAEETIEFFSEYHKSMETIGIPPDKHETDENEEGKPLSAGKSSKVSTELFQKAHLYAIQNTNEIVPYIERHKQVLKIENPSKQISFLENEHSKSFAKWLRKEVLDYRFRQIPLFKCDWVNHRAGGVKRDNLRYTLVNLNNLGHKVDPFILASQARQVFYVKDQIDKKLSIVFKIHPKNYKDTYDEVDEE
ncbi:hypothetical protein Tco_0796528 [Tanacetum coccineum]